jgi:hypothetical protein
VECRRPAEPQRGNDDAEPPVTDERRRRAVRIVGDEEKG